MWAFCEEAGVRHDFFFFFFLFLNKTLLVCLHNNHCVHGLFLQQAKRTLWDKPWGLGVSIRNVLGVPGHVQQNGAE